MTDNKIIVGLSGGVDSAVTLRTLVDKGYNIEALFMKNWDEDDNELCSAEEDLSYASDVSDKLNVKLHTVNFSSEYWDNIFLDFIEQYKNGYTPNPDIICNKLIKFKVFLDYAKNLGASKIATGHYAKIHSNNNEFFLSKPADLKKDQTYFLYTLSQSQLQRTIFPLEDIKKDDVRKMAKNNSFKCYDRKDSTGICFIGKRKFNSFISKYIDSKPGYIYNDKNEVMGEHNGIFLTTIGQRTGLGIGGIKGKSHLPWYVYKKDIENNSIYVCQGKDHDLLFHKKIHINNINIISEDKSYIDNKKFTSRIRHLGALEECYVSKIDKDTYQVNFTNKVKAPALGQSLVLYDNSICVGGGIIEKIFN